MIDPTLRNSAILAAGDDSRVAVLLLDVILGFGAHNDPAGAVMPVLQQATDHAAQAGRPLAVWHTWSEPRAMPRGWNDSRLSYGMLACTCSARITMQR